MILTGDCVEKMREMDEASIDAVVCDPPYSLAFMGRSWDTAVDHNEWAQEALRVLKPGGHLLAFGGTRTYHRLACAIEDAGFEIRDSLIWLYGSGFPKSLDVSKAIDKAAGAEREVVGRKTDPRYNSASEKGYDKFSKEAKGYDDGTTLGKWGDEGVMETAPATPEAAQWEGWGTALKPGHEPIVMARKPLIGTVAQNVTEHGTGALNIDGCRIGTEQAWRYPNGPKGNTDTSTIYGGGDGLPRREEPLEGPNGRWPANCVLSHLPNCGKMFSDCAECDINEFAGSRTCSEHPDGPTFSVPQGCAPGCPIAELDEQSGEKMHGAGAARDQRPMATRDFSIGEGEIRTRDSMHRFGDSGGASRFFATFSDYGLSEGGAQGEASAGGSPSDLKRPDIAPLAESEPRFRYQAKASRGERNAGLDGFEEQDGGAYAGGEGMPGRTQINGEWVQTDIAQRKPRANVHPTVKPIDLMRWLVRLVTPPGGTVLDPFTGSGTTGIATVLEGFDFIGIEREAEYVAIAEARIAFWTQHAGRETVEVLIAAGLAERIQKEHDDRGQLGLLEDAA